MGDTVTLTQSLSTQQPGFVVVLAVLFILALIVITQEVCVCVLVSLQSLCGRVGPVLRLFSDIFDS